MTLFNDKDLRKIFINIKIVKSVILIAGYFLISHKICTFQNF